MEKSRFLPCFWMLDGLHKCWPGNIDVVC
jgi:hypothetical protein